jgi:hypothetical protein
VKSHITILKAAQPCRYLVADAALYVKGTIALNEVASSTNIDKLDVFDKIELRNIDFYVKYASR